MSPSRTRSASPDLVAGAVVLDPLVGVEEVAADLRSPGDVFDLAALLREPFGAFALLELDQLRAQELHRRRLVLGLRALVLALDDDPARDVGDPHRRVGLVDVLAARSRGAVGVDPQLGVVDLDRDVLVDHRPDVDLGEARVAAGGGVEGRDPDQPVDAALGGEEAVGVLAAGDEGRRLQPRLLAGRCLLHLDLEAAPLRPAQVHPQQDLGPVLGVGAAGAGVDGDHRVAGVVLAAEQARLFELGEALLDRADLGRELARQPSSSAAISASSSRSSTSASSSRNPFSLRWAPAWAALVRAAASWSSQNPGRCISSSSRSTSPSSEEGSKIVREQLQLPADSGEPRRHRFRRCVSHRTSLLGDAGADDPGRGRGDDTVGAVELGERLA